MSAKNNLVWIDLEMTGLDAVRDVILEIAVIITDNNLNIVHTGPSIIVYHPQEALEGMNAWVREQHTKSGLLEEVKKSAVTTTQAQDQVLAVIKQFCQPQKGVLCGNSVWQDAAFIKQHMPAITDYLHYRIIDVSSIKEVVARWYPNNPNVFFVKKDAHRAMIDIQESIAELAHYRKTFFISSSD